MVHRRGGDQWRGQPAMRHLRRLHRCGDAESAPGGAAQSGLCGRVRLPDSARLHQRSGEDPDESAVVEDIERILRAARPEFVYLHNLADKHDTHIAVALRSIAALRAVRPDVKPRRVYGCEVWRDLDWLPDESKQVLPVSARSNIAPPWWVSSTQGERRQALRPGHRRPAPGARHVLRLARDRRRERSQLRMDLTPLVEDASLPVTDISPGLHRPVPRGRRDADQDTGQVTAPLGRHFRQQLRPVTKQPCQPLSNVRGSMRFQSRER